MNKIGFAVEFYTLWEVSEEPEYFTDACGKHHLKGIKTLYHYLKNISTDLTKVNSLYPGIDIDENLRGKTRSWSSFSKEDLCPEYLKFGKHKGKNVYQVAEEDFDYCLWLLKEGHEETSKAVMQVPKVIEYLQQHERQKEELLATIPKITENGLVDLLFTCNPRDEQGCEIIEGEGLNHYYALATLGERSNIKVFFDAKDVKCVQGRFPYYCVFINGKAKRINGKSFKLNIELLKTEAIEATIYQEVKYITKQTAEL